jgi:hypothetical protein
MLLKILKYEEATSDPKKITNDALRGNDYEAVVTYFKASNGTEKDTTKIELGNFP